MDHSNASDVQAILSQANEQVNIFDGGRSQCARYGLSLVLETPGDWLSWMLHDADLHEQMARMEENDFDRASSWENAALLRKYALALLHQGILPIHIEWGGGR